jgi:8-oxo-dGTP diphosphatase
MNKNHLTISGVFCWEKLEKLRKNNLSLDSLSYYAYSKFKPRLANGEKNMNDFDPNYQSPNITFIVGQKAVIFNDQDEILFLRRSEKVGRAGGWDFPGGRLEHEQPVAGLKREIWEETQLTVQEIQPIGVVVREPREPDQNLLVIGYMANWQSGEVTLSWEHTAFQWLNHEQALGLDLPEHHQTFLKSAIKNRQL